MNKAAKKPVPKEKLIALITERIGGRFRCFGGGDTRTNGNPIAFALRDEPLQFAAGVDVADVVRFVLEQGT